MMFDCGETREARIARQREWHDFFALWPRTVKTVNGRRICAWLETIQRKAAPWGYWDGQIWAWEYRPKCAEITPFTTSSLQEGK